MFTAEKWSDSRTRSALCSSGSQRRRRIMKGISPYAMIALSARAWRSRLRWRSVRSPLTHSPSKTPTKAMMAPAIGALRVTFAISDHAPYMWDIFACAGGRPPSRASARGRRPGTPPRNERVPGHASRARADRRRLSTVRRAEQMGPTCRANRPPIDDEGTGGPSMWTTGFWRARMKPARTCQCSLRPARSTPKW